MSSVVRSPAQVASRYLWSEDNAYAHTFQNMQDAFASYNPVYNGSLILFANDTDIGDAVNDLEDSYTSGEFDSQTSLLDLGKKIYLGVKGGISTLFTYTLARGTRGTLNNGAAYYVLTGVGPISDTTQTALGSAGDVLVGRGA